MPITFQTNDFTASGSVNAPAGSLLISDAWAIGGGQGGTNSQNVDGGYAGGKGTACLHVTNIAITALQHITVTVGTGGLDNAPIGDSGTLSQVTKTGGAFLKARGGSDTTTVNIGTIVGTGGNGGTGGGTVTFGGGGGGGSGGMNGNGGNGANGTTTAGGVGGTAGLGGGGVGGSAGSTFPTSPGPVDPTQPGAGGYGGARDLIFGDTGASPGSDGFVRVVFQIGTVSSSPKNSLAAMLVAQGVI